MIIISNLLTAGGGNNKAAEYIDDIIANGASSYVLDPANESIWQGLLNKSPELYGPLQIHTTVYNRLTNAEAILMVENNGKLGESLNNFYSTADFLTGSILSVMPGLTESSFSLIEDKIRIGIYTYIYNNISTSENFGQTLASIYNVPSLSSYTTMESLINDSTIWSSTILSNNSLRLGVTMALSLSYIEEDLTEANFNTFLNILSSSRDGSSELYTILDDNDALSKLWLNNDGSGYLFDSASSMTALLYHETAFQNLCEDMNGVTTLCSHTSQYNLLFGGWTQSIAEVPKLATAKSDLATLNTHIAAMPETSNNFEEIYEAFTALSSLNSSMTHMNNLADYFIANYDAFNTSSTVWSIMSDSYSAMTIILANSAMRKQMFASDVAMSYVCENTTWMPVIVADLTMMTEISSIDVALKRILLSSYATSLVKANSDSWLQFVSTTSESTIGASSATITALQASEQYATISCGSVYVVGYGYLTDFRGYANLSYTGNVFILTGNGGPQEFIRAYSSSWQGIPSGVVNQFGNSCRAYAYHYRYSGYVSVNCSATVFKLY